MTSVAPTEMIPPEEAADVLGCTPDTLADELRAGNLPGVKFGREWRIPRRAFFDRVNAIAIEQAEERRAKRSAPPAPPTPQPAGDRAKAGRRRPLVQPGQLVPQ